MTYLKKLITLIEEISKANPKDQKSRKSNFKYVLLNKYKSIKDKRKLVKILEKIPVLEDFLKE